MTLPTAEELLTRTRSLPALAPLLDAVAALDARVYLVGGAVRDLLRDREPVDIDVCVDGDPAPLLALLPGGQSELTRFGTATVTAGTVRYDIARARSETYRFPGALPEVEPAGIEVDLQRRDFTVNAIAMALNPGAGGQLFAVHGAFEHLRKRRLEVLHERSFHDDPTRLFRLARYATRLWFEIGPVTEDLAEAAIASGALRTVSGARIGNELRLNMAEPDPIAALAELARLGIDRAIDPDFGIGAEHSDGAAVTAEAFALMPSGERRDLLALAAAMLAIPPERGKRLLDGLAFTAGDRDTIIAAAGGADQLSRRLREVARPSRIAAVIGSAPDEAVALAGALGARQQAWEWLTRLRGLRLEIGGSDLTAAGVPQGSAIGIGLAAARAALLDGYAGDRESQLQIALDAARPD